MKKLILLLVCLLTLPEIEAQKNTSKQKTLLPDFLFAEALAQNWKVSMQDDFNSGWKKKWFKDGKTSRIQKTENGINFYAGSFDKPVTEENHADHTVLWTKQSFDGDIMIEYDYTRLDSLNRFVSILYFCAEGSGKSPYSKDIYEWKNLRKVPAMNKYFNNMNAYHISFAAHINKGSDEDYLRARRYMPHRSGLKKTALDNEYFNTGFFETGVKHHITVISRGNYIFMRVTSPKKSTIYYWSKDSHPLLTSGRVGFRLMYYRGANFDNVKISTLKKNTTKQ